MDFVDKKERLALLLEQYANERNNEVELLAYIKELNSEPQFRDKELFANVFNELLRFLTELSRKEIKQRALIIRSFIE